MSTVSDYLKSISRRYPDTREIREQIEELRDTLHLKTEELQAQGKPYDEAAREAIESIGDITRLFGEVSGNIRTVYANCLSRDNALVCSSIILVEFLLGWLAVWLTLDMYLVGYFIISAFIIIVGVGIWPLVSYILWKREPLKIEVVNFNFRSMMRTALIVWLILSVVLLGINLWIGTWAALNPMWFQWPMIGIANWPLNIWLYHRQLTGGHYDA